MKSLHLHPVAVMATVVSIVVFVATVISYWLLS